MRMDGRDLASLRASFVLGWGTSKGKQNPVRSVLCCVCVHGTLSVCVSPLFSIHPVLFSLSSLPLLRLYILPEHRILHPADLRSSRLHGRISRNNQSRLHHNLTTSSNQSIDLRFCKIELAHDPRVVENARFKCHLVVLLVSSRTTSCVLPQSPAPPPYCCSEPRPDTGMMGNTTPYLHPPPRLDHSPYWDTHVGSTDWGPQANTPNMDSSSGHKMLSD
ncbi:uncharacterized protein CCOS01_11707 [Colletotrichum costaricense]|uniref:Uncharacterized protein n=1 Tax=Colletotrichum costaricense TaxID=1209916 RepID=A0AAI9YQA1_9PEZI|nr:uncharacterized protein CCOS01_11707 [Colletotrichum costaricense]KAK1518887.1 hypothetical protein CCOS01_11707 [Colletotrichum costaricense]